MRKLIWSALAATCLLAAGSTARAQGDTFRLGGPSAQADIEGGTDTALVYYRGGGGYGRGHYGGHYGGYGRGFYGGGYGRGFYGGYGRGYGVGYYGGYGRGYYGGYGRGYYGGYGLGLGYYGGYGGYGGYYSPAYYYTPTYYYSQPYCSDYYYGISGDNAPLLTLQATSNNNGIAGLSQRLLPFSSDGTYPYNGGPASVIPMPAAPLNKLQPSLPVDGKLVTLPTETRGGFSPVTSPDIQRLRYVTTPAATATPAAPIRVKYPAYGEK